MTNSGQPSGRALRPLRLQGMPRAAPTQGRTPFLQMRAAQSPRSLPRLNAVVPQRPPPEGHLRENRKGRIADHSARLNGVRTLGSGPVILSISATFRSEYRVAACCSTASCDASQIGARTGARRGVRLTPACERFQCLPQDSRLPDAANLSPVHFNNLTNTVPLMLGGPSVIDHW
jgi:hypothetical protein